MTLPEAIATQDLWIRIWVGWLGAVILATPVLLLLFKSSRRYGAVIAASTLANMMFMQWLYGEVGFVRLLGLPHVVIWTPLAVVLFVILRSDDLNGFPRRITQVFLASICISLMFDYVDVARWLLGERASMLPAGA